MNLNLSYFSNNSIISCPNSIAKSFDCFGKLWKLENGQGRATVSLFRERVSESRSKTRRYLHLFEVTLENARRWATTVTKSSDLALIIPRLWNELRVNSRITRGSRIQGLFSEKGPELLLCVKTVCVFCGGPMFVYFWRIFVCSASSRVGY